MELRVLITLGVAAGFVVAVAVVRWWLARRRAATLGHDAKAFATPGHATILYFYTDGCEPCRRVQKPELDRLAQNTTNVIVRAIDAVAERDIAQQFRVLTVPTTVVLGPQGRVVAVNYGVAPQAKLQEQVAAA